MMVALVKDLFFAARVEAIAKISGAQVHVLTNVAELEQIVRERAPSHALLDLQMVDGLVLEIVRDVPHVAGFGPHVQREHFLSARQHGIRTLWANSALGDRLPAWLKTP